MPNEEDKKDIADAGNEEEKTDEGEEIKEQDEVLDDKDYTPETRKTPWANREERDEFFKNKNKGGNKKANQEGEDEEEDDKEGKVDIGEAVRKAVKPIIDIVHSQAVDSEINVFLAANPQFKKFEKLARKDAVAYPNTPISKIFRALAYNEDGEIAKKIEVKKAEAKNKQLGGSSQRKGMGAPIKPSLISDEKLREVRLRVRTGEKINPLELE